MSYTYYSIMRPIGIGTIPRDRKPESIRNYTGGRQKVKTADGVEIMAWGEVTYTEPLTDEEIYSYELRGEYKYQQIRKLGKWCNGDIDIIKVGNRNFALFGWNGESYGHCWECKSQTETVGDDEYTLTPVYFYDTDEGIALMNSMYDIEEGTDEWEENEKKLNEIVSYKVQRN